MNENKISILREIIVTQMNHWAFYPLMLILFSMSDTANPALHEALLWLAAGLLPLIFCFFREKINKFSLLAAAHVLAVIAVNILFSQSGYANVYVFAAICYVVYSFVIRFKGADFQDVSMPLTAAVGISAVSLFFLKYIWQGVSFETPVIIAFISVFGLSMLNIYLERYINFLAVNKSSSGHIPTGEIFRSGLFMAVLCVLLMMTVLLLTSGIGWLKAILNIVKTAAAALLKFLLSLIKSDTGNVYLEDSPKAVTNSDFFTAEESSEPALIWEILTAAAFIAVAIALIYLLIKGIKRLYAYIRERMAYLSPKTDADKLIEVNDIREKCSEADSPKSRLSLKKLLFERLSPSEKIRQLYRKNILRYNESDISPELLTADEWGERMNIPEMSAIYDRTRYSDMEISSEDVKMFRKSFNSVKS